MRKRFVLAGFCFTCFLICINGYYNKVRSDSTGAPSKETGSPYDGNNCTSCHGGHPTFTGRGTITTNIPAGGYTASTSYTITATLYSPALVVGGFELSPQDTTGTVAPLGTITASSNTQTAPGGGSGWITHKSSSNTATNGTITWTMSWTAPATGKGPVIFYAAFNRSNDNGQDTGDSIFLTKLKVYEDICGTAPGTPGTVSGNTSPCSGTSVTYSVAAVTGATSYIWTLPSGWTGTSTTNSITVTTGTTSGNVTVKAAGTCDTSSASSQAVTVTSISTPSVSISGSQSICAGSTAAFTATPVNGGTSPSYQWQKNGSDINGATQSTFSSSTLANGDMITVVMTSDAPCSSPSTATSNSITLTVTSPVTPAVSIISNGGNSICSGQSVTISATPVNGGGSPSYQWYKDGSPISGATSSSYVTSSLANNDSVWVVMISSATCASPDTVTSNKIAFTIVSNATPNVSITSSPSGSICAGTSVTFSAAPVNGGTSPTYQWYKNGNLISGATSSQYATNSLANNDSVYVEMTSNSACVTSNDAKSNTIEISVTATLTPSVSIASAQGDTACSGTGVNFTASPTNGGTSPAYQWLDNGSPVNGATNSTFSSSTLANGDVISVSMTSSSSCASPTSVTSNDITMNIQSLVSPSVSVNASYGNIICAGQGVTFTAVPVNGGAAPAYQWFLNGSAIQDSTLSAYASSSLANGDVISVRMTSSARCPSENPVNSGNDTLTVSAGGPVAVSISSGSGTYVCEGAVVTFSAAVTLGGASPVYEWMKNGSTVGSNTATYIDNSLTTGDIFKCFVTSSLSCASPDTATSNALDMTVNAPPVVGITQSHDTLVASAGSSYQWYNNNVLIGGATSQFYVPALSGPYSVVVTDVLGCSNTASYNYVTGIEGLLIPVNLKIYPNPVDDVLFVDLSSFGGSDKLQLNLYDLNGKLLVQNECTVSANTAPSLFVQNIPGGVYLLRVCSGENAVYRKVIIGH